MKRSEMLKLIEVQLLEDDSNEMIHGDGKDLTYEEMARIALKVVEREGITPPHVTVINCNCYDHNWEPEDEKK